GRRGARSSGSGLAPARRGQGALGAARALRPALGPARATLLAAGVGQKPRDVSPARSERRDALVQSSDSEKTRLRRRSATTATMNRAIESMPTIWPADIESMRTPALGSYRPQRVSARPSRARQQETTSKRRMVDSFGVRGSVAGRDAADLPASEDRRLTPSPGTLSLMALGDAPARRPAPYRRRDRWRSSPDPTTSS